MADRKRVRYGKSDVEFIVVNSLTDELKFIDLMKLYKACPTLQDLTNALTEEAKEAIRLID